MIATLQRMLAGHLGKFEMFRKEENSHMRLSIGGVLVA